MATKTVGLTGRDYSTFAAYATYVNALTFSANEICEVYNDGGAVADTTAVTIGGYTPAGFTLTIRAASGQGFADNANRLTNALRYNASNGAALTNSIYGADGYYFSGANITVTGLQFQTTTGGASSVVRGANSAVLNRCIFSKDNGGGYVVVQGATPLTINDSLLMHKGSGRGLSISANFVANSCTIANSGTGDVGIHDNYSDSPVVKNTLVYGFTTDFDTAAGSGTTNNATSKASFGSTGWGTSGQVSVSTSDIESATSGSEDWRIKSGSTKLPALGVASVGSGFDVVGKARSGSSPSIGAWESAAAAALAKSYITLQAVKNASFY
jgi:hypothetical protein